MIIFLVGCTKDTHLEEGNTKEVVVNENLKDVVSYDNLRIIEKLVIKGEIKEEDWNIIYEMALTGKLSYIDMTEASIIGSSTTDEYKDNVIPPYQFSGSKTLQSIILPSNLEGIGTESFAACSKLQTISFPESLEFIGDEAFSHCTKLSSIELSNSIDSIGIRAFYKTPLTGHLVLPKKLRVIAKQAFAQTNITEVTIDHDISATKDSKMYVKDNNSVFASCEFLQRVNIEEGCSCLEVGFSNCKLLSELKLPSTIKYIGRDSKSTHNYIFKDCTSLKHVQLPEGLTHIGIHVFESTSMQTLEIPKTVKYIGDYSFKNAKIPSIKVNWNKPLEIESHLFDSYDFINSIIYIPVDTYDLYKNHKYWGKFGKIIEF